MQKPERRQPRASPGEKPQKKPNLPISTSAFRALRERERLWPKPPRPYSVRVAPAGWGGGRALFAPNPAPGCGNPNLTAKKHRGNWNLGTLYEVTYKYSSKMTRSRKERLPQIKES